MANKDTETFASKARKITKQYTRAEFDDTERAELEQRLSELAQEQEAYKDANGLNEQPQQEQMPQMQQFPDGGWFDNLSQNRTNRRISRDMDADLNTEFSNITGNQQPSFGDKFAASGAMSYIPSLASGAISMVGNIRGATRARNHTTDMLNSLQKPDMVNAVMQNPQLLNLEEERSNIRQDFSDSKSIMSNNLKDSARGRGEYLSSILAANTSIDRNKARAISESHLSESKYNAAARERTNSANTANKFRADTYNSGINSDYEKMRMAISQGGFGQEQQYRDAAYQVPGQMSRDMMSQYNQDQMISSLGRDYGYTRDPNRKWWEMPQWKSEYQGRNKQA